MTYQVPRVRFCVVFAPALWQSVCVPPLDGFILAVSVLALGLSVLALVRGAPAKLLARQDAVDGALIALRTAWESTHSDLVTTLSSITEERERAQKAQARTRSERQRLEETGNGAPANETREAKLARLRRESGLLQVT